jgi:tRNA pseudouridine13 synthase
MMQPAGRQGNLEAEILKAEGLAPADFDVGDGIRAKGQRRALRFQMTEPELWYDHGVMIRFELPKGCYATTVLAELMKVS